MIMTFETFMLAYSYVWKIKNNNKPGSWTYFLLAVASFIHIKNRQSL